MGIVHKSEYDYGRLISGATRGKPLRNCDAHDNFCCWELTGEIELYDLGKDLSESNNLASSNPALARAMGARLRQWRHDVNAQMPQENPAYNPRRVDEWWNRSTIKPTEAPGTYAPAAEKQGKP